MAYQVPKADHPWRRYANKYYEEKGKEKSIKSVKIFIQELAEGWDNIEIVTTNYQGIGKYTLSELPQSKQASWLAGVLKRYYAN